MRKVLVMRDEYGTLEVFRTSQLGKVIDLIFKNSANYTESGDKKVSKREAIKMLKERGFCSFYEEGRNERSYELDFCNVQ